MSRHGFSDDGPEDQEEQWAWIRYRGAVNSAIKGKKGQAFLKELLAGLTIRQVKDMRMSELGYWKTSKNHIVNPWLRHSATPRP